jgi:RNA polymerase sigma-70 factor (ECF subfamily)
MWIETLHEREHDRDDVANRELQIELERALSELPDEQRAAIVLVDVEGYSVEDAAAILECPSGTVKSRCSRGRAKLAKRLEHVRNPDSAPNVLPQQQGGEP